MTRRTVRFFVTLTLGLLVASLAVAAPPSAHVPRIGLLSVLSPAMGEAKAESFRQGVRELGYLEGRDILLETAVHHPATFAGLLGQQCDSSGSLPFAVFSVVGFDFAIAVRPL